MSGNLQDIIEMRVNAAKAQGYLNAVKDLRVLAVEEKSIEAIVNLMIQKAINGADGATK